MTKLNEMWAALEAYLPQAQAAGYGESWARMCKEKTRTAAKAAADATAYAVAAAGAVNDAYAANAAYVAANAVAYATVAPDAADAAFCAQKAIDRMKRIITKEQS